MKRLLFLVPLLVVLLTSTASGQVTVKDLISWKTAVRKTGKGTYTVILSATIISGWHIFMARPGGDGMFIPTTVSFNKNKKIRLTGNMSIQGKVHTREIKDLDYSINYYEGQVSFSQRLAASANTTLSGSVEFQV